MTSKLIKSISEKLIQPKNSNVFILISAISVFIRLPFFFRDYIDRDESTFILMGQSWVDGHLPYTELWDLKPPVTFLFFAGIIYVFGKSFVAIRFIGAIVVATTAFYTYKIGEQIQTKKTGLIAAFLCVVLLSLFGSLQGVMSEHISMLFFMPAFFLLLKSSNPLWFLISGFLMGLALLSKLNMAYAALFCGLFLLYNVVKDNEGSRGFLKVILYGTGILTIVLLSILPYWLKGEFQLWYNSVVLAPLEYIAARRYSIIKLAPLFIIIIGFLVFVLRKKWLNIKDRKIQLILVAITGILLAFYKGGRINGHYLIQLHPLFIILLVISISQVKRFKRIKWKPLYFAFLFLVPIETYLEFGTLIKNKSVHDTFYNGEGFSVPKYIDDNQLETENILFLGYHIGYWNLGKKPPIKSATHPSNICRDELFPFYGNNRKSSIDELKYIMDSIQPKTIVIRKNRRVFDKEEKEENEYINSYLSTYYKPIATVEKAEILQRLE